MDILVEPLWLVDRLRDPNTVILDATLPPVGVLPPVDTRSRYLAAHIPGAVFFDIDELSDHSTDLPHMLPSPDSFSRQMAELGVSDRATIVVYEQEGVFSAPRAWWMLRTFGAHDVHVLNGGFRGWQEAGLSTEAGEVHRPAGNFRATLDPDAVITFAQLQQLLARQAQIVDARSAGRFAGTLPEPRPGLSSGHMPGSTSLPFTELVEEGRLKDAAGLRRIFKDKGLDLEQPITTSCGSGVTAAVLLLGLELAGAKQVQLYDGSWAEYARRPEAVIEKIA
jgi:thiosulfate/3-mercaptopyruvate sulfurtransferase